MRIKGIKAVLGINESLTTLTDYVFAFCFRS